MPTLAPYLIQKSINLPLIIASTCTYNNLSEWDIDSIKACNTQMDLSD